MENALLPENGDESPQMRDSVTIPVGEETLHVTKQINETGTVRVRLLAEEATKDVATTRVSHKATLSRRTMNVEVDAEYEPHQEGDEWVIPVFEYRPVVHMQLFLTEEIRVARESISTDEMQQVVVKRQRVITERQANSGDEWAEIDIK